MVRDESVKLRYFVKIDGSYIVSKLSPTTNDLFSGYTEVTKEIYDKLTYFPYEFVIENEQITDVIPTVTSEKQNQQILDGLKKSKVNQLSEQCRNSIMYEFVATNGHQYRLEIEDQLNMQGQKDELDNDDTILTVMWRTIDSGYIEHTREEWYSVFREAFNHKKAQLFKLDELRTQALNATTQEELNIIVW